MNEALALKVLRRIAAVAARRHAAVVAAFAAFHRTAPRLAEPRSFNEKILWRKLFDRNPLFTTLHDKLAAKDYVRGLCPDLAMARVLWAGTRAGDIPFDALAEPYIVKCNHGSAYNIAVPDPAKADRAAIVARMAGFLAETFGVAKHEPAYWPIRPQVYVEALLPFRDGAPPADFRVTVIAGRVAYIAADTRLGGDRERGGRPATDYRDRAWTPLPVILMGTPRNPALERPPSLARMVAAAERLAAGLDMLRVDFYEIAGEPVFGEFTVYPLSGHIPFTPPHFDLALGALWDIRASHLLKNPARPGARLYRAALDAVAPAATAPGMSLAQMPPRPAPAA